MIEPITSLEELQNTIALGLDLWVVTLQQSGRHHVWCLKQPRLVMRARGLAMGSTVITDEYLARWGITDSGNHHTIHTYGQTKNFLFNTMVEAEIWEKRKFKNDASKRRYY